MNKKKYHTPKLLRKHKQLHQTNMFWFSSKKKNFCHNQMVNTQNKCWLALSLQDVAILIKAKHPILIISGGHKR